MRTATTPHTRAKLLAPVVLLGALLLAASATSFAAKKDKRIAELPERYQTWIASVELLMIDEELAAFLELDQDYQRDAFIERFWRSRDPYPETTRNELKDNWERRLFDVLSIFGRLDEARAEMMMLNGEPAGRLEFRCSGTVYDMEAWFYDGSDRVGYEFWLLFYQRNGLRTYRLWRPDDGIDELIGPAFARPADQYLRRVVDRILRGERVDVDLLHRLEHYAMPLWFLPRVDSEELAADRPVHVVGGRGREEPDDHQWSDQRGEANGSCRHRNFLCQDHSRWNSRNGPGTIAP